MTNISNIRDKIIQKILNEKIDIPYPTLELVMDADGEFDEQQYLTIGQVKEDLGKANTIGEIVTFLKKYFFHINYSGKIITPDFLESLIDSHTLAVHGLFIRPSELEYEIHTNLSVFIGNSAAGVFSKRIMDFELFLFDSFNVHFISSSWTNL